MNDDSKTLETSDKDWKIVTVAIWQQQMTSTWWSL